MSLVYSGRSFNQLAGCTPHCSLSQAYPRTIIVTFEAMDHPTTTAIGKTEPPIPGTLPANLLFTWVHIHGHCAVSIFMVAITLRGVVQPDFRAWVFFRSAYLGPFWCHTTRPHLSCGTWQCMISSSGREVLSRPSRKTIDPGAYSIVRLGQMRRANRPKQVVKHQKIFNPFDQSSVLRVM